MDQKKEKNGGQESVVPEKDYKEAYEQEHYKAPILRAVWRSWRIRWMTCSLKLDRIKNNPVWKASTPLRKCMHFAIRQVDRVKTAAASAVL